MSDAALPESTDATYLLDFVRRFSNQAFASEERGAEVLSEHEEIIKALEDRDPDRAERVARGHVARARGFLTNQYLSGSMRTDEDGDQRRDGAAAEQTAPSH